MDGASTLRALALHDNAVQLSRRPLAYAKPYRDRRSQMPFVAMDDFYARHVSLNAQLVRAMADLRECAAAERAIVAHAEQVRENKDGFGQFLVGVVLSAEYRAAVLRDAAAVRAKLDETGPERARIAEARRQAFERIRRLRAEIRAMRRPA